MLEVVLHVLDGGVLVSIRANAAASVAPALHLEGVDLVLEGRFLHL